MSPPSAVHRLQSLDAFRGLAMIAVCLAHFGGLMWDENRTVARVLLALGHLGTPAFLLVSGAVCAYVWSVARSRAAARVRILDRALFLMIFAHVAIGLSHWPARELGYAVVRSVYVTDALGIALLIAACTLGRATRRAIGCTGIALLLASWVAMAVWRPIGEAARAMDLVLFGVSGAGSGTAGYIVPLVPYIGLFLIGVAMGLALGSRPQAHVLEPRVLRSALWCSVACVASTALLKLSWMVLLRDVAPGGSSLTVYALTDPLQKIPAGPAYVLLYAGLSIGAGAGLIALYQRRSQSRLMSVLATIGRASLAVYIFQYVLFAALASTRLATTASWPLLLAVVSAGVFVFAFAWDAASGNRMFTLGLPAILARRRKDAGRARASLTETG